MLNHIKSNADIYATIIILIVASFNISGIIVGSVNQNATCYQNKNIISLSHWLILSSSGTVFFLFPYITTILLSRIYKVNNNWLTLIYFIILGLYHFALMIIGGLELIFQYSTCILEVSAVCHMTVTIVAICVFVHMCLTAVMINDSF